MENGICYGPYRDGQSPGSHVYPSVQQITDDLQSIRSMTSRIRTYSSTNISASIPIIAKQKGLTVYQGVNLSSNQSQNDREIASAIELANQGLVDYLIVGNEILLTKALNKSELIDYIDQVKQNVPPNVKVTTAEPYNIWIENPDLMNSVDFLMIHIHPFWMDQTVESAAKFVVDCYNSTKKLTDKPVVIGETGWPSAGNSSWTGVSNETIASEDNQKRFLEEFGELANRYSITYFYFDAFDEEFKWNESTMSGTESPFVMPMDRTFSGILAGSSWGLFYSNGTMKPKLLPFFPNTHSVSSRAIRDIFTSGQLQSGYDMGVNSSANKTDWLTDMGDCMRMTYPASQEWGSVFITVGAPTDAPRPYKNMSGFSTLSMQMRGEKGGEILQIGIKDSHDPDNGSETKMPIMLTNQWQTYHFPLTDFGSVELNQLYVVVEFVFMSDTSQTVYFQNISYLS